MERSKIIRFKTMFDESNDETYVPLIDMITYDNKRISIHNIMPWQHEMIFKRTRKSFIIKDMERAIKPGIIFQTLIVKAILIPKTIYLLRKTKLNEDIVLEILKNLYPKMEKYIQQWINQEVQIIEHIKIQIIYQIRDRTTEEKELQKCKSRDKQRIQRKINRLKYINRALWRHYFELYEAYNNINEFHKEITKHNY